MSAIKLSNKTYDTMKWATTTFLPAVATLYFGLTQIFDFLGYGGEVVATITLLTTFLGVTMGLSSKAPESYDGVVGTNGVDPDTGIPGLSLVISKDPYDLFDKDSVRLKVNSQGPASEFHWDA